VGLRIGASIFGGPTPDAAAPPRLADLLKIRRRRLVRCRVAGVLAEGALQPTQPSLVAPARIEIMPASKCRSASCGFCCIWTPTMT